MDRRHPLRGGPRPVATPTPGPPRASRRCCGADQPEGDRQADQRAVIRSTLVCSATSCLPIVAFAPASSDQCAKLSARPANPQVRDPSAASESKSPAPAPENPVRNLDVGQALPTEPISTCAHPNRVSRRAATTAASLPHPRQSANATRRRTETDDHAAYPPGPAQTSCLSPRLWPSSPSLDAFLRQLHTTPTPEPHPPQNRKQAERQAEQKLRRAGGR